MDTFIVDAPNVEVVIVEPFRVEYVPFLVLILDVISEELITAIVPIVILLTLNEDNISDGVVRLVDSTIVDAVIVDVFDITPFIVE